MTRRLLASVVLLTLESLGLAWPQAGPKQGTTPVQAKAAVKGPATKSTVTTGVFVVRVRDFVTGYSLPATVTIQRGNPGQPGTLSRQTDKYGRLRIELPSGSHSCQASAPGYQPETTHFSSEPPAGPFTVMFDLHPEKLPEEQQREVLDSKLQPGYTLVDGYVVDAVTGRPLANVRVHFEKAREEATTNENGYFFVSVPAPPSQEVGGVPFPGTDTMFIELPGYQKIIARNIFLPDGTNEQFNFELEKGTGVTERDYTHKLLRGPEE